MFGPKFISLYLSDNEIKLALAKSVSNRFKISFLVTKKLPHQTIVNGKITNLDFLKEELRSLFVENFDKFKTKSVVVGLSEPIVYITEIVFNEKPHNVENAINENLKNKIPFEISTSKILFKEISRNIYQIAAIRTEDLVNYSTAIENAGFNIKALVPITLISQNLVGNKPYPYIVISSEENINFTLVINGAVVFTSTLNLGQEISKSENELISITSEIIENKYKSGSDPLLKKIFISGKETEFIKSFLAKAGYDCEVIFASDKTDAKVGMNANNFSRAITLSLFDSSFLFFNAWRGNTNNSIKVLQDSSNKKLSPILLFLPLILIALTTFYIFWPNLKDIFWKGDNEITQIESKKITTSSSNTINRTSTASSSKSSTVSAEPQIQKSNVKIKILNGSGTVGAAGIARDFLISKGYKVESVGNATKFDYKETLIQSKKSVSGLIPLLTKDLKERYSNIVDSNLSESVSVDIIIIIGGN